MRHTDFPLTDSGRRIVRFTLATMVTTLLLVAAGVPSVHAGSQVDPEIQDNAQDVNPAAFATHMGADNESLFDNATAYDIVRAWIGAESATHFLLFIQVEDLPDDWGPAGTPPPQSPFGANASFAGTSLVANFSVAGKTYWAIAKLAHPGAGAGLLDNYTLWRDGAFSRPLSGAYSLSQDLVQMRLPKAAFLGLADDVKLEKFWVQGRFGNHAMDFAPNAKDPQAPSLASPPDPIELSKRVASGQLVLPQYGRDYAFGQYYRAPTGGPTAGPAAPNLVLRVEGAAEKTIEDGASANYDVFVQNLALSADTVYLTLSSASTGWEHDLEVQSLVLQPGQASLVSLQVRAAEGAQGGMRSMIDASSQLGASRSVGVLTMIAERDPGPSSSEDPDEELPVMPAPSEGGGAPGLTMAFVLALVAAVAVTIRRGTR